MSTPWVRWVVRAQVGDRRALDQLLRALSPGLSAYLRTLLPDAAADDALQETLLRVALKLKRLRAPGAVRAWAYRIAARQAFAILRTERRREEVAWAAADDRMISEAATALGAELHLLDRWLDRVPPKARSVLWLHYIAQLSLSEIAAALEIKPGTVKSRLAYGIRVLRSQVEPA